MIFHSDNAHFGDLFWALLTMSKTAGSHTLHCNPVYHAELRGLAEGLPIAIEGLGNIPPNSLNCWIASGQFPGIDYRDNIDIMAFVMRYMNALCRESGQKDAFKTREDLLCGFPSIERGLSCESEIMVLNADPKSGQCPRYSSSEMDGLISLLRTKHEVVISNSQSCSHSFSTRDIGSMSRFVKLIIASATGPMHPTFNIWNKDVPRIVLLDPMRLNYGTVPIEHAACAEEAQHILERTGWL